MNTHAKRNSNSKSVTIIIDMKNNTLSDEANVIPRKHRSPTLSTFSTPSLF